MPNNLGNASYQYELLVDILAEMASFYIDAPNNSEDGIEEKKEGEDIE